MSIMEDDIRLFDSVEYDTDNEALMLREEGEELDNEEDDYEDQIGLQSNEEYESDDDLDVIEVNAMQPPRICILRCLSSRSFIMFLNFTILLLLLSSIVAILVVSVIIVKPYHEVSTFLPTFCSPAHTTKETANIDCSCGKVCRSQFPCIMITVRITTEYGKLWTTGMVDDETLLNKQVSKPCKCILIRSHEQAYTNLQIASNSL
jgi:hypothetical protein